MWTWLRNWGSGNPRREVFFEELGARVNVQGAGPWRHPLVCPRKAFFASLDHLAEGRAPHARNDGTTATLPPFGHRFIVNACGGNEMSRRTYGLATRARRPRPSEKSALHIIPGPSPTRPCSLGSSTPRRGGLRTPVTRALASRRIFPVRVPAPRARIRWKWNPLALV
jgi:hypothetical protein